MNKNWCGVPVSDMRIWRIATLSRDLFGTYICAGVFTMLLWQVFQNVGMTLGIMPVTGLPMPFISYGGSSLVSVFILTGLIFNVAMRRSTSLNRHSFEFDADEGI